MEGFLSVMSDFQRSTGDSSKVTKYLQSLLVRYPNAQLDAMDVWDDVIDSRNVMIEELERLCDKNQVIERIYVFSNVLTTSADNQCRASHVT